MGNATAPAMPQGAPLFAYAGEISPREAWDNLSRNPDAMLIDVRTPPEWAYAGEPDLGPLGKNVVKLSWRLFPTSALNEDFTKQLKALNFKNDAPLYFLCRTGGRSIDAAIAMTAEGFTQCYNVTDGFEGPLNAVGHRGIVAGWKAQHLPWRQA